MKLEEKIQSSPDCVVFVLLNGKRVLDPLDADDGEGWVEVEDYEAVAPPVEMEEAEPDLSTDLPESIQCLPVKRLYGQVSFACLHAKTHS